MGENGLFMSQDLPTLSSQTESPYVQKERIYVQTFVPSGKCVRSSCAQNSLCHDFRAFKIIYDQTFVRSKPKIVRSNFEHLCVHAQTIVRSKQLCPDFRAVKNFCAFFVRSIVRMSRFSCVYFQTYRQFCSYKMYTTFL